MPPVSVCSCSSVCWGMKTSVRRSLLKLVVNEFSRILNQTFMPCQAPTISGFIASPILPTTPILGNRREARRPPRTYGLCPASLGVAFREPVKSNRLDAPSALSQPQSSYIQDGSKAALKQPISPIHITDQTEAVISKGYLNLTRPP